MLPSAVVLHSEACFARQNTRAKRTVPVLPNAASYLSKQTYQNIQSSQQVEIMRNPDDDVLLKTQSFNEYAKYNRMPQLLVLYSLALL